MSIDIAQEIRGAFTADERRALEECRCGGGHESRNVLDVLASWALHVQKLDSERSVVLTHSIADAKIWGAHDLVAAQYMRNHLEDCLQQVPEWLRSKVVEQVARIDDRFMSFTKPDDDNMLARFDEYSVSAPGWWWHRIPVSGPVLEDLLGNW